MDGAGSYSVAHRAGLPPTELTGMWGWILLRSPHQGRSPSAPAPTQQGPSQVAGPRPKRRGAVARCSGSATPTPLGAQQRGHVLDVERRCPLLLPQVRAMADGLCSGSTSGVIGPSRGPKKPTVATQLQITYLSQPVVPGQPFQVPRCCVRPYAPIALPL